MVTYQGGTHNVGVQNQDSNISGQNNTFGAFPGGATAALPVPSAPTPASQAATEAVPEPTPIETALRIERSTVEEVYVLGVDTVDFSSRSDDQQVQIFRDLLAAIAENATLRQVADADVMCQLTGDGVMLAVKGAANRHTPLRLALALNDLNTALRTYRLRFGVNAGPVKWFILGDGSRQVTGHAINWAARVMDAARSGQVLVSGHYYNTFLHRAASDAFPGYRFSPVGGRKTKKGEPIAAYDVAR